MFACCDGRDDGGGAAEGKLLTQFCGIVASIGDQAATRRQGGGKGIGGGDVRDVAGRQ